jgi:hypothetical protein
MVWQVVWLGAGSDGAPYSCGTAPESGGKGSSHGMSGFTQGSIHTRVARQRVRVGLTGLKNEAGEEYRIGPAPNTYDPGCLPMILLLTCYLLPAAVSDNASTRSDDFDFFEKTKPPRINEWAHDFPPAVLFIQAFLKISANMMGSRLST